MTTKEFNTYTMLFAYTFMQDADNANLTAEQRVSIARWLANSPDDEVEYYKRLESKVRVFANNLLKGNKDA